MSETKNRFFNIFVEMENMIWIAPYTIYVLVVGHKESTLSKNF